MYEENHLKVLRLLEANPSLSQRELAGALGVSLGKTNYCVRHLLDGGLIKIKPIRNDQNKPAHVYLLTPAGLSAKAHLITRFLKAKVLEQAALAQEIKLLRKEADSALGKDFHEN